MLTLNTPTDLNGDIAVLGSPDELDTSTDLSTSSSEQSSPTSSPDYKNLDGDTGIADSAADDADESSLVSFNEDTSPPKHKKVVKFRLPHEEELSRCWDGRRQRMEKMTSQYWALTGSDRMQQDMNQDKNTLKRSLSEGIIRTSPQSQKSCVPPIIRHDFSVKEFEHLVACQVCYQLIFGRALICEGCKLLCHMKCELKVIQPCNGSAGKEPSTQEGVKKGQQSGGTGLGTYQSTSSSSNIPEQPPESSRSQLNGLRSRKFKMDEIEVMFITERILVLTYPGVSGEGAYRCSLQQVSQMLRTKHGNKYKIFNLSKRRFDLCRLNSNVVEFGWPEELSPPLERLCALCKEMENWLTADAHNVLVVHCKGGKSRPAILIAAYMHYTDICASEDQALDRFAMKRFTDDYFKGIAQPSHKRYVTYFSGLLSGAIRINSSAIFLRSVSIVGLSQTDAKSCQPYMKIYERMVPVFTSGVYDEDDILQIQLPSPLSLRGDVLLKCYNSTQNRNPVLFRCQFNTCALDLNCDSRSISTLTFTKVDLDQAVHDINVRRLELAFSLDPSAPLPLQARPVSPLHHKVPRTNSYENFETTSEDAEEALSSGSDTMTSPFPKARDDSLGVDAMYASIQKPSSPLANESTDSGVSTASNHHNAPHIEEELLERPVIKVQARRPTLETARDQLIKVFGKFSPEREAYEGIDKKEPVVKTSTEYPKNEVLMEASVKSVKSPPATLPKPKRDSGQDSPYPEDLYSNRAVMPPKRDRAGSPAPESDKRPTTPHSDNKPALIDRELVGEDRYDPQSKAFSYVPVRALEDHFKSPKKQTRMVQRIESNEGKLMDETETDRWAVPTVKPEDIPADYMPSPAESVRVGENRSETGTPRSKARKTKYANYKILDSKEYNSDMDDLCDPDFYLSYVNGQAKSGGGGGASEKSGSNQLLNAAEAVAEQRRPGTCDEALRTTAPSPPAPPVPPPPAPGTYSPPGANTAAYSQTTAKPEQMRKSYAHTNHTTVEPSRVRDFQPLDDILQSTSAPLSRPPYDASTATKRSSSRTSTGPPSAWYGRTARHDPVKSATSWDAYLDDDDYAFGARRNMIGGPYYSRSVTSTPIHHTHSGRPTAAVSSDRRSLSSMGDFDADEWLELQLEKLRMRRDVDPDVIRRKNQEKLLLNELKHIHEDRMVARGKHEADYTVEGYGTKTTDPLDEWQREQERLQNTQSPYTLGSYSISTPATPIVGHRSRHALVGRQGSLDLGYDMGAPRVTGKPPTPPPRERSRTPPSPRRMSPVRCPPRRPTPPPEVPPTSRQPQQQQRQPNNNFDYLESILWNDADERQRRRPESAFAHQSPKSILKKPRELSQRYSNSSLALTPQTNTESASRQSNLRQPYNTYTQSDAQQADRPETPAFPVSSTGVRTETPLPYHPLLYDGAEFDPRSPGQTRTPLTYHRERPATAPIYAAIRSPSPTSQAYYGQSHRSSLTSLEPMEVIHHHPVFVKDTSKYWYKPTITREDAINILKDKPPGTFIVRDSNSFPGAFGLALKVATPPPGVHPKSNDGTELVRHFLIEPTSKGVKLKGCNNEPVFGTLSALVYQHSITPLALPSKLLLPDFDPSAASDQLNSTSAILEQGAACNVTYIHSCDTESLTGPEAVRRAVEQAFILFSQRQLNPVSVHFKASGQGITVTDNTRKRFFRRHYPVVSVGFCSLDPEDRRWTSPAVEGAPPGPVIQQARIFGFVARKIASRTDNACHIFAELEPEQPATAIVNFVSKVMMGSVTNHK